MLNYPPMKRLFVGFDNLGRALEIIAIEDDERECLIVIDERSEVADVLART